MFRVLCSYNLGYVAIYETDKYHVVQDKGDKYPELRVEPNDCDIKPYKKQTRVYKAMSFSQYCDRPPINQEDIKCQKPNEHRFEVSQLLPDHRTGTTYRQNLNFLKTP